MATRAELKALADQAAVDARLASEAAAIATLGDRYAKNAELYPEDPVLATMYSEIVEKLNVFELAATTASDDASKVLGIAKKYEEAISGAVGGADELSTTANALYYSVSGMLSGARGALKKMTADPLAYIADNEAAIIASAAVDPTFLYVGAGTAADKAQASAKVYADAAALKAVELSE